ncbi:DUF6932 family protein [Streptomyces actinomycinicus]|uniref:DUF6932 family protein n=1 Tax=Streptomyces actinomycinicus TaxID=1695166 RepID=UPI0035591D53
MVVPDFTEHGYLPAGDHDVTWPELCERFGWNDTRRDLLANFKVVRDGLDSLKVETIWLNGSFATSKHRPSDIDVIYVPPAGADITQWGLLSPRERGHLKQRSGIDLWAFPSYADHGPTGRHQSIKDFMSTDRDNVPKGMLLLAPGDLP